MELLRRKPEETEVIRVRVPAALKRQLAEQRRRAARMGFNYTATLVEVLSEAAMALQQELVEEEQQVGAESVVDDSGVKGSGSHGALKFISDGRRRRDH
jgi:hypothetical protein